MVHLDLTTFHQAVSKSDNIPLAIREIRECAISMYASASSVVERDHSITNDHSKPRLTRSDTARSNLSRLDFGGSLICKNVMHTRVVVKSNHHHRSFPVLPRLAHQLSICDIQWLQCRIKALNDCPRSIFGSTVFMFL